MYTHVHAYIPRMGYFVAVLGLGEIFLGKEGIQTSRENPKTQSIQPEHSQKEALNL